MCFALWVACLEVMISQYYPPTYKQLRRQIACQEFSFQPFFVVYWQNYFNFFGFCVVYTKNYSPNYQWKWWIFTSTLVSSFVLLGYDIS